MKNVEENLKQAFKFVKKLERLDKKSHDRLKRFAGRGLAESQQVWRIFYSTLPYTVPRWREPTYFLIATAYPFARNGSHRNLGASLGMAAQRGNLEGAERLLNHLLDADLAALDVWLPAAIRFIGSAGVPVHWLRLVCDIQCWETASRRVQRQWAREYANLER